MHYSEQLHIDAKVHVYQFVAQNVLEPLRNAEHFFGNQYRVSVVIGNEREKRKLLSTRSDIYVTNFETVSSLNIGLRLLLEAQRGRGLLVIDESYFVKNKDARRTQVVRRLRDAAGRCFVLCGTPAPNAPSDLVEQFNISDGGQTFSGVQVPDDRGAATEVVRNAVVERGLYLRRLKDNVLHLPERTFHKIVVPLQPKQDKAYRTILGELIGALRSVDEVSFKKNLASFAARRMALLQICSNPSSVVSEYNETPAKVLALDSLLEELVSKRGEKVVRSTRTYRMSSSSKPMSRRMNARLAAQHSSEQCGEDCETSPGSCVKCRKQPQRLGAVVQSRGIARLGLMLCWDGLWQEAIQRSRCWIVRGIVYRWPTSRYEAGIDERIGDSE